MKRDPITTAIWLGAATLLEALGAVGLSVTYHLSSAAERTVFGLSCLVTFTGFYIVAALMRNWRLPRIAAEVASPLPGKRPRWPDFIYRQARSRRSLLLILTGFAVAAAVAAAISLAPTSTKYQPARLVPTVVGGMSFSHSPSWLPTSAPSYLPLPTTLTLQLLRSSSRERLTAGYTKAPAPTFLATDFRRTVSGALPRARIIAIGTGFAFLYSDLKLRQAPGVLDVYVIPTTSGVATFGCLGLRAPSACGEVARTLHVVGALAVQPKPSFASALTHVFRLFVHERADGLRVLQRAQTPAQQAGAAQRLAGVYNTLGSRLARLSIPALAKPVIHTVAILAAKEANAYASLRRAAMEKQNALFARSAAAAHRDDDLIVATVRQLRRLGYKPYPLVLP